MLKLALAAAAALFVVPAFGQQLPAAPSCDLGQTTGALDGAGLEVLGAQAMRFSPITEILVREGQMVGVVFVLSGCPEHTPDGRVAVHLVGPYRPESSS